MGLVGAEEGNRANGPSRGRDAERTRTRILGAGRRLFAGRGFQSTTVKAVADAAGVSPNLITRYFGGKEGLFLAATQIHLQLDLVLTGPRGTLGRRLAEGMVARWTSFDGEDPLLILLRAAGDRSTAASALRQFLDHESLHPIVAQLRRYNMPYAQAHDRAAAVEALVMGVVVRQRVLTPVIDDPDTLRDWLATAIQHLIDAP